MNQEFGQNSSNLSRKPRLFKFVIGAFVALFVLVAGYAVWQGYNQWKLRESVENFAKAVELWEKEIYERQLADTYGGKTPQETLQMYIEAVEKGDYELASKYFVLEKQEGWLKELNNINNSGKLNVFLSPLKKAKFSEGAYSEDKKQFFVNKPVSVDFLLYPNGIWKISEI